MNPEPHRIMHAAIAPKLHIPRHAAGVVLDELTLLSLERILGQDPYHNAFCASRDYLAWAMVKRLETTSWNRAQVNQYKWEKLLGRKQVGVLQHRSKYFAIVLSAMVL